jgi:hypothetical protein
MIQTTTIVRNQCAANQLSSLAEFARDTGQRFEALFHMASHVHFGVE